MNLVKRRLKNGKLYCCLTKIKGEETPLILLCGNYFILSYFVITDGQNCTGITHCLEKLEFFMYVRNVEILKQSLSKVLGNSAQ